MDESDIWDEYERSTGSKVNEVPTLTGTELAEMSPSQMMDYDNNNEKTIHSDTTDLTHALGACEQIVIAAYKVADYVPIFKTDAQSKFWKEEVIPNLVDSLTQDVKARSLIVHSFASIRDLSIIIQKAGLIVKQTKGSPKAIQIAQKNIPGALARIDKYIEEVSNLENTAIVKFASQTKKIFDIIGPEAARFVEQKAEIESQLHDLYVKQQSLYSELGDKKGEVTKCGNMISATEKHLYGAQQDLKALKRRTEELNQLNSDVERTIQNIPKTVQRDQYRTHNHSFLWFTWTSTSHEKVDVANPDRESDTKYCEGIIMARMARAKENKNDEEGKQRALEYLSKELSEQQSKYEKAKTELEKFNNTFKEKMDHFQEQINALYKKIEEIDNNELDAINMTGLRGNVLIECLISVRTYAKSIKGGTSAYAPLVAILSGIKAMVQNEVELLSSDQKSDIFLAGNLLMQQVKFLSSYSVDARRALQSSESYNALAKSIENKTGAKLAIMQ